MEETKEGIDAMMGTALYGPIFLIQKVVPKMPPGGRIISKSQLIPYPTPGTRDSLTCVPNRYRIHCVKDGRAYEPTLLGCQGTYLTHKFSLAVRSPAPRLLGLRLFSPVLKPPLTYLRRRWTRYRSRLRCRQVHPFIPPPVLLPLLVPSD